jgi:hypothetical protein
MGVILPEVYRILHAKYFWLSANHTDKTNKRTVQCEVTFEGTLWTCSTTRKSSLAVIVIG